MSITMVVVVKMVFDHLRSADPSIRQPNGSGAQVLNKSAILDQVS